MKEGIKFCDEKYNLLGNCNSIRLGTLTDFRTNYEGEDDMINDNNEGYISYTDVVNNVVFNIQHKAVPNCYVFCVSETDYQMKVEVKSDFKEDYKSNYVIEDLPFFASCIRQLLYYRLGISDLEISKSVLDKFTFHSHKSFEIIYSIDRVKYVPNKHFNIQAKEELIHNTLYYKKDKYKAQKEIRIAFFVHHHELGLIDVKPDPIFLDLRSVAPVLSSQIPPRITIKNGYIG